MSTQSATIVQRLWNYCNVLRDDGVSCTIGVTEGHRRELQVGDEPMPALLARIKAGRSGNAR